MASGEPNAAWAAALNPMVPRLWMVTYGVLTSGTIRFLNTSNWGTRKPYHTHARLSGMRVCARVWLMLLRV
jgi:hypothetical protein